MGKPEDSAGCSDAADLDTFDNRFNEFDIAVEIQSIKFNKYYRTNNKLFSMLFCRSARYWGDSGAVVSKALTTWTSCVPGWASGRTNDFRPGASRDRSLNAEMLAPLWCVGSVSINKTYFVFS